MRGAKTLFWFICTLTLVGTAPALSAADDLDALLAAQPDEVKARYAGRHPSETLSFFGVKPGMTVVEAFPGGG